MSAMTLDLPRRFPWPTLLSVAIHGAVVAAARLSFSHHGFVVACSESPLLVGKVVQ